MHPETQTVFVSGCIKFHSALKTLWQGYCQLWCVGLAVLALGEECRAVHLLQFFVGQFMLARTGYLERPSGTCFSRYSNRRFQIRSSELLDFNARLLVITFSFSQERVRISKFHFIRDAKLALVGRLMLKAAACLILKPQPDEEITFLRTPEGKPYLSPTSCIMPLPAGATRPNPNSEATLQEACM
jgi:hypothetical protein